MGIKDLLIHDIKEEQQKKASFEIHLLQEQIQPHFLYNTLFSDACDEGVVVDYFLRMQTVTDKNRNTAFVDEIKDLIKGILFKIDEVLMKR